MSNFYHLFSVICLGKIYKTGVGTEGLEYVIGSPFLQARRNFI